jgi:hypothetical protein
MKCIFDEQIEFINKYFQEEKKERWSIFFSSFGHSFFSLFLSYSSLSLLACTHTHIARLVPSNKKEKGSIILSNREPIASYTH